MDNFTKLFLKESIEILNQIDTDLVDKIALELNLLNQKNGRLFFLGVGGSAANCSHAVNDFRKITGFEAYAPTDNVSELTARINDEGWDTVFVEWLKVSSFCRNDGIFIFSVGGGDLDKNISPNLVKAVDYSKQIGSKIFGVVGKESGYTALSSNLVLTIPLVNPSHITPHTEAFQAVIWHLLVSHPLLKKEQTKWESTQ